MSTTNIGTADTPEARKEVVIELDDLSNQIYELDSLVEKLVARLDPVLNYPEKSAGKEGACKDPELCDLASDIKNKRFIVLDISRRINTTLEALQL